MRIPRMKLLYNLGSLWRAALPKVLFQRQLHNLLNQPSFVDDEVLNARIVYYNKLDSHSTCSENAVLLKNFKLAGRSSAYFFDTQIHTRYFPNHLKADFLFGDITYVPTSHVHKGTIGIQIHPLPGGYRCCNQSELGYVI